MPALQNYLDKLSIHTGYISYTPPLSLSDDANEANAWQGRSWQIRIAVEPTKPVNLLRAAQTVAPLLIQAQLEFKCLVINDSLQPIGWYGTKASLDAEHDRDQRGKEICIYVRYDNSRQCYEKTLPELKTLLLQCWQALYQARVTIGYMPAAPGDKALVMQDGITPFSYTAFKPFNQRHGILQQTNYNPLAYTDPLSDLILGYADLIAWSIPAAHVANMYAMRLAYLQQDCASILAMITNKVSTLCKLEPIPLTQIISKLLDNTQEYTSFEQELTQLVNHYPRHALSRLVLVPELAQLIQLSERKQLVIKQNEVNQILKALQAKPLEPFYRAIAQDFLQDRLIMQWWQEQNLNEDDLLLFIQKTPATLQLLHRQLTHALREQAALNHEASLKIQPPAAVSITSHWVRFASWLPKAAKQPEAQSQHDTLKPF